MSVKKQAKGLCEYCHKEMIIEYYDSINVTIDKDLRNAVITGELYQFECPHCHKKSFIPFPILYHDMEKRFMVKSGTIENLLLEGDEIKTMIERDFKDTMHEYKIQGASNAMDLMNKVLFLERGYNVPYAYLTIAYLIALKNDELKKKKDKHVLSDFYLLEDKDELLVVLKDYSGEYKETYLFPDSIYTKTLDYFKEILDKIEPFYFNLQSANNLLKYNDSLLNKKCELLVLNHNGNLDHVAVLPFNEGHFKKGDYINYKRDNSYKWGEVVKVCDYSFFDLPLDLDTLPIAMFKEDRGKKFNNAIAMSSFIDNEIIRALILNNQDKEEIIYRDISDTEYQKSDILIGLIGENLKADKDADIKGDKISIKGDYKFTSTLDGRSKYFDIFLDGRSLDHNKNHNYYIKTTLGDFLDYYFNHMSTYSGIRINYNIDKSFDISNNNLFRVKYERILSDEDRVRDLLISMTLKEREYVTDTLYKLVRDIYERKETPKSYAEKHNLEIDKVNEMLDSAYDRLTDIIVCSY